MIQASSSFIEAVTADSRMFRASLLCDDEELNCEIVSMNIHKGASVDQVVPGAIFIPYIEFSIRTNAANLAGKTIVPVINLVIDHDEHGDPIYDENGIRLGEFIATKPEQTTDTCICKAVGKLSIKGGTTYVSSLAYPPAVADVISEISAQLGVPIVLKGLTATGNLITSMSGELLRDALGYIACILGGFVTEDSAGNIVIAKYGCGETLPVAPWKSQSQPTFAENDWMCTGIRVVVSEEREEETVDEEGEPVTVIIPEVSYVHGEPNIAVSNPYMTPDLFDSMYPKIEGFSFRPCSIDMSMGDPRIEAWDLLSIEDLNGDIFEVPCLSIAHKYHGGLESEIACAGKSEVEETTEIVGPLSKQIALAVDDAATAKLAAGAAIESASTARRASEAAAAYADTAAQNAASAQSDAALARSEAESATASAMSASGHAASALRQLGVVEDIVGVLDLLQKNGDYELSEDTSPAASKWYFRRTGAGTDESPYKYAVVESIPKEYLLTADTEIDPEKTYYTRSGAGTEEDPYVYTAVETPAAGSLSTYYEYTNSPKLHGYYELIGISDAIQNYVSSHMVLSSDGLWLQPAEGSAKVHISTKAGEEGVVIIGPDGTELASYGSKAIVGDKYNFHLELEGSELGFYRGSERVAYMNGSELYVENRLSFGNFAFMQRGNGHFTLKLIGGNQ